MYRRIPSSPCRVLQTGNAASSGWTIHQPTAPPILTGRGCFYRDDLAGSRYCWSLTSRADLRGGVGQDRIQ